MPGDRKHHSDKWRSCVDDVMGKGHDESSASAICTTSLQNSGEAIFEGAEAQSEEEIKMLESAEPAGHGTPAGTMEELHLCGAIGKTRYEQLNGRRHLVVPVVALMEGVIHPVNAETPEFVSAAVIQKAAASWVGKPVTLGHPKKNGTQCSATDAEIRKAAGVGVIMRSESETGKKLLQEAWIDEEKAKQLHPQMYKDLEDGKPVEVSVGTFVVSSKQGGDFNGKPFKATWHGATGDHLAFLPGGRGACSCEMGCGTHRAAMHFVAAESIELLPQMPAQVFSILEGKSLDDRIAAVNRAVNDRWTQNTPMAAPTDYAYVVQVFDDRVIVRKNDDMFMVDYTVNADGEVMLGTETKKVKQQWVEAASKYAECDTCHGTGQVKEDGKQSDCPTCGGEGKLKAAAGARHSSSDMKMIQTVHDHAVSLGATCDRKNLETAEETPPVIPPAVRREGTKWVLYSTDGLRRLATHDTEAEAKTHEQAMQKTLAKCG
jgi:hypothetical protein